MSDLPTRPTRPAPRQLLARILDEPGLVEAVRALEPRALGRLIDRVGLEDAGELVALATTPQLERIFDEDLWRGARPGEEERFDAERFVMWLEVMLEAGDAFAARKLAALPEELVMLALERQIMVIDVDALAVQMAERGDDDVMVEKALDSCLQQEFGQYRVMSRRHDGWDAVLAVLVALDENHGDLFQRLMERCCHATTEWIDDNGGLYRVLTSTEMIEEDAAADREARRARQGYVAPSSAASFLALARTTALAEIVRATAPDPITRAWMREWERKPAVAAAPPSSTTSSSVPGREQGARRLLELIEESEGPATARPAGLLGEGTAPSSGLLRGAMAALGERDPDVHARRVEELGFLVNTLVAGASHEGRALRPVEVIEMAVAACNLGLDHLASSRPGAATRTAAEEVLRETGADKLFRVGFRLLAHEVALPAARALAGRLAPFAAASASVRAVERSLQAAIAAHKPWTARRRLTALAGTLAPDEIAIAARLIDECPSLAPTDGGPAGDDRVGFIATVAELERARAAVATLANAGGSPP